MNVLDLFSGIGAFSLGLEAAGMRTVAFCEIDPFARKVLKKHWPGVPCYEDVTALTAERLRADGVAIDVICGGFPCQDISVAGKGAGIGGDRSGLWSDYARIVRELRPRYVVVENVAALLGRGVERVLGDLAALGYDAEWHCIPAAAVGAPHLRDRVWIVAYAGGNELRDEQQRLPRRRTRGVCDQGQPVAGDDGASRAPADAAGGAREVPAQPRQNISVARGHSGDMADAERVGRQHGAKSGAGGGDEGQGQTARRRRQAGDDATAGRGRGLVGVAGIPRLEIGPGTLRERAHAATSGAGWWAAEPDVGRVVDGPADRVDRRKRLAAIGNALVPQIPQIIGEAIMMFEGLKK